MGNIKFGAILPHTLLYGGVKRFFELGQSLKKLGNEFIIFTPEGSVTQWSAKYDIKIERLANINLIPLDVVFFTEKNFFEIVLNSNAKFKIFYHVREGDKVKHIIKNNEIITFGCSSNIVKYDKFWYNINAFPAFGGINLNIFKYKNLKSENKNEVIILAYGRIAEKRKGTKYIIKACEKLHKKNYPIKLILFDTPVNDKMSKAINNLKLGFPHEIILNYDVDKMNEVYYKADIFVSAEKRAGWANTVAEAMASGVPVIATKSGTKDLVINNFTGLIVKRNTRSIYNALKELIFNYEKRNTLPQNARKHVEQFDWNNLAKKIIDWYNNQK